MWVWSAVVEMWEPATRQYACVSPPARPLTAYQLNLLNYTDIH